MLDGIILMFDDDLNDFQVIFQKLNLPIEVITNLFGKVIAVDKREDERASREETIEFPSIKDFAKFKKWLLERMKAIELRIFL